MSVPLYPPGSSNFREKRHNREEVVAEMEEEKQQYREKMEENRSDKQREQRIL